MEAHGNGVTSQNLSKLKIVSIMSVPPFKVTEPRKVCQVLVSDTNEPSTIIQGCYQIVLYYEKVREENLAGWIVESLARVLLEYPLLAGRLQRKEIGDDTTLEIVSNDSGIRLLEAQYPTTLSDFLEFKEKNHLEDELVFWKEIDDHYPEFSPLFYVQLTNFDCGGHSIGISCSLLLAEILVVENFLMKWAQIHNNMLNQNEDNETPIFYHPHLKNPDSLPSDIISQAQSKIGIQSMVFKITAENVNFSKELWGELAMLCVEETEQKLDIKTGSEFSLVVKESPEVIKIESRSKSGHSRMQGLDLKDATWNDFGVYKVAFHEGNEPINVSCWIASVAEGHVMALQCPQENVSAVIVVSPPREN